MANNAATKWITNEYTCKIPTEITDVQEVFALDMNLSRMFKSGATRFDQFDPKSIDIWEPLFQLFIKFGQVLWKESINSKKAMINVNCNDEPVQFYLESVISSKNNEIFCVNVCGYTFYIVVKTGYINPGEIWKKLILDEPMSESDKITLTKSLRKYKTKNTKFLNEERYSRWKVTELTTLAKFKDVYIGKYEATNLPQMINAYSLSDPRNPVSCTKMFNLYNMFIARTTTVGRSGTDLSGTCIKIQSPENSTGYIKRAISNTLSVTFPLRGFVLRIPGDTFTVEILMNSIFPSHQKKHMEIIPMIPVILSDYETSGLITGYQSHVSKRKETQILRSLPREDINEISQSVGNLSMDDNVLPGDNIEEMKEMQDLSQMLGLDDDASLTSPNDNASLQFNHICKTKGMQELSNILDLDANNGLSIKANKANIPVTAAEIAETLVRYNHKSIEFDPSLDVYTSEYSPVLVSSKRNTNAIYQLSVNIMSDNIKAYDIVNKEEVIRQLTIMSQLSAFHSYETRCRLPNGKLSPYECAVYHAIKEEGLYNHTFTMKRFDLSMSTFAALECNEYMKLEQLFLVQDRHKECHIALLFALDANRREYDMHAILCLVSVWGETSKSFVYQTVMEQRIKGTCEVETSRSDKSDATDEKNRNGAVIIIHELKKNYIHEDKTGKSELEAENKNRITSGKTNRRRLIKNSDGTFRQVLTDTDTINVELWATNLDVEKLMSPSFRSRVHVIHIESDSVFERSLLELKMAESIMTDKEKFARQNYNLMCHQLQALDFEVCILIWLGGLHNIGMHIPMIFNIRFDHEMRKRGNIIPARTYSRVCIMAQKKAIRSALVNMFYNPASRYYGKPIQFKDLIKIDRWLFCTIEHTVSAIGELLDAFIDRAIDYVLMALRAKFKDNIDKPKFKVVSNGTEKYDPTYVEFDMKKGLDKFCKEISAFSSRDPRCIAVSPEGVKRAIQKMENMTVETQKYRIHPNNSNLVVLDQQSEVSQYPIMQVTKTKVYLIYTKVIGEFVSQRDEVVEIIKSILEYEHQVERKLIFDNDEKKPYIRNFIEIIPKPERGLLAIPTPSQLTSIAKAVMQDEAEYLDSHKNLEIQYIDVDIDTYGVIARNDQLGITSSSIPKDFIKINCFLDNDVNNVNEGSGIAPQFSSTDTILSPNHYDPDKAYFMGDSLESYFKMKDIKNVSDVKQKITNVYKHLDRTTDIFNDYDFDPNDFIIRYDENEEPVYHWDILPGKLNDPKYYKLVCVHPSIADHFTEMKCYSTEEVRKTMISYPNNFIEDATKSREEKWRDAIDFCKDSDRADLAEQLKNGVKSCTYELDEDGEKVIRSNNVYVDLEKFMQSNNYSATKRRQTYDTTQEYEPTTQKKQRYVSEDPTINLDDVIIDEDQ